MTQGEATFYALGDQAAVVRFGEEGDPAAHAAVESLARRLDDRAPRGVTEYISALNTVTVLYDARDRSYAEIVEDLQNIVYSGGTEAGDAKIRLVEIPVCYGGDSGPDLDFVASYSDLDVDTVVQIHCEVEYVVHMIGFAPGFPYLGGLDERIAAPRRDSPRGNVPAGSVGIAGKQTGIYSIETPGGWQLIGRTPLRLFSPARARPSLLRAGDHVRFVPISLSRFAELVRSQEP